MTEPQLSPESRKAIEDAAVKAAVLLIEQGAINVATSMHDATTSIRTAQFAAGVTLINGANATGWERRHRVRETLAFVLALLLAFIFGLIGYGIATSDTKPRIQSRVTDLETRMKKVESFKPDPCTPTNTTPTPPLVSPPQQEPSPCKTTNHGEDLSWAPSQPQLPPPSATSSKAEPNTIGASECGLSPKPTCSLHRKPKPTPTLPSPPAIPHLMRPSPLPLRCSNPFDLATLRRLTRRHR